MLTALAIDHAKPRDEPYVITDGQGLHLLVNTNGSKLWRLRYRFRGKQNMLSLALAAPQLHRPPRFRALALFGRRPHQRIDSPVMPATKNLHNNGSQSRYRGTGDD